MRQRTHRRKHEKSAEFDGGGATRDAAASKSRNSPGENPHKGLVDHNGEPPDARCWSGNSLPFTAIAGMG